MVVAIVLLPGSFLSAAVCVGVVIVGMSLVKSVERFTDISSSVSVWLFFRGVDITS